MLDFRLVFSIKERQGLIIYTDLAYINSVNYCSTTGFIFMINNTSITWNSRKQSVTA